MTTNLTMAGVTLSDPALFRQVCYVDGARVTVGSGETIAVDNPTTGGFVGVVPKLGAAETRRAVRRSAQSDPNVRVIDLKLGRFA